VEEMIVILDELTKQEIINWVRGQFSYFMHPPCRSNLLFQRWEIKEKKIYERRRKNIEYSKTFNMKKRDEYARKFNAAIDLKEKTSWLRKMEPHEEKFKKYLDESKSIMAAEKTVDKLYKKYEAEWQKEQAEKEDMK
jgi:hypothetical protein